MRQSIHLLIALVVLVPIVPLGASAADREKVVSADGRNQITLPDGWKEFAGEQSFDLHVADRTKKTYVVGWALAKENLVEPPTLDDYARQQLDRFIANIVTPEPGEVTSRTINGYEARQVEIRGAKRNQKKVYFLTVLETPKLLVVLYGETQPSRYEQSIGQIREVIESYKEVDPNRTPPAPSATKPSDGK
jgi:hypothetical protein